MDISKLSLVCFFTYSEGDEITFSICENGFVSLYRNGNLAPSSDEEAPSRVCVKDPLLLKQVFDLFSKNDDLFGFIELRYPIVAVEIVHHDLFQGMPKSNFCCEND